MLVCPESPAQQFQRLTHSSLVLESHCIVPLPECSSLFLPLQPSWSVPQHHHPGRLPDDSDQPGLGRVPGRHQGRPLLREPQLWLPAAAAGVRGNPAPGGTVERAASRLRAVGAGGNPELFAPGRLLKGTGAAREPYNGQPQWKARAALGSCLSLQLGLRDQFPLDVGAPHIHCGSWR